MLIAGLFLTLAHAQPGERAMRSEVTLQGRCSYNNAIVERAQSTTLLLCEKANLAYGEFAFTDRSGKAYRFIGKRSGNRLAIDRIRIGSKTMEAKSGVCEIFYANDKISVVSCLANVSFRSYAINFIPDRF